MITDTCPCGATFSADHSKAYIPAMQERESHIEWLKAHSACREFANRVEISGVEGGPIPAITLPHTAVGA